MVCNIKVKEEFSKINTKKIQNSNPKDLFTHGEEFIKNLTNFSIIENNKQSYFKSKKKIELNTAPLTRINKQFNLLKQDLKNNQDRDIKNIILCSSEEQEKRFKEIFNQEVVSLEKFRNKSTNPTN